MSEVTLTHPALPGWVPPLPHLAGLCMESWWRILATPGSDLGSGGESSLTLSPAGRGERAG
jgi:hypothetical protein